MLTAESTAFLEGLNLNLNGDSIETVKAQMGTARLLSIDNDVEVVEISLAAEGRLFVWPSEENAASETYYLLEGILQCFSGETSVILKPSDSIVASDTKSKVILSAKTDVKLLYVTNQPFFYQLSEFTQELMQLAVDIEVQDGYTADHCKRLQTLSYATGKTLDLDAGTLYKLNYGAFLHDLGKVKVPASILQKPAKLDPSEWDIIKKHPSFGRNMLENTVMKEVGFIVEQHHERLDGSGYPYGLAKDDISVESYIVAVVDTYDAMTTDRSYRKALGQDIAFAELDKYTNIHYPKEVVAAFKSAVTQVEVSTNTQV